MLRYITLAIVLLSTSAGAGIIGVGGGSGTANPAEIQAQLQALQAKEIDPALYYRIDTRLSVLPSTTANIEGQETELISVRINNESNIVDANWTVRLQPKR